jgi:hypothetical protein
LLLLLITKQKPDANPTPELITWPVEVVVDIDMG